MSEIIERPETLPVAEQTTGLARMIEQICMNPDVDVNKLERMLDMQERILDKQAEQSFQNALAEMQADLPMIERNGEIKVGDNVRSKYAKFEDINRAVLPVLQKHGFSITFETNMANNHVAVIGVLRHKDGHKESTMLPIPIDQSGAKNAVQAVGSSVSYGKRYVMSALLNINTTDDDDDGQAAVPAIDLFAHNVAMQKNYDTITAIKTEVANGCHKTAYLIWASDVDEADKHALWVAPSKGGIFTTRERESLQKGKSMGDKE
jgi:hypothetical protein